MLEHHTDAKLPRLLRPGNGQWFSVPEKLPGIRLQQPIDKFHKR